MIKYYFYSNLAFHAFGNCTKNIFNSQRSKGGLRPNKRLQSNKVNLAPSVVSKMK